MNLTHPHFTKITIEGVEYEATDGVFDVRPTHAGRALELGLSRAIEPEVIPEPEPEPEVVAAPPARHERSHKAP